VKLFSKNSNLYVIKITNVTDEQTDGQRDDMSSVRPSVYTNAALFAASRGRNNSWKSARHRHDLLMTRVNGLQSDIRV